MLGTGLIILVCTLYMGLLLTVALWVERRTPAGRRLARSGVVYALSLAVYCTSWTFYGSVGFAVRSGFAFLAIYLGPTLTFLLGWVILRKLVRLKSSFRFTSIADLISMRYERSMGLGALVTVGAIVGSMPYIALQLRSLSISYSLVVAPDHGPPWLNENFGPLVAVALILFTIVVGVRHKAPTERHEGMVAAIAVESVVKLVAFLAAGLFVTYGIFDGFDDIFRRIAETDYADRLTFGSEGGGEYVRWTTLIILSAVAVLLLPRQFHVAVVENSRPGQIRTAMWLFPLYMLLINIFVLPIALGGLLVGLPEIQADSFLLRLLLNHGRPMLVLLIVVGGFSAATGMIMVSAMTLSTMVSNHLILPIAQSVPGLGILKRRLLVCRWVAVAALIAGGHLFERHFGDSFLLVNIGLISFAATLQFAPAVLAGIFWTRANRIGAFLGLSAGLAVWAWTLLVPALVESGWLGGELLTAGPWGIDILRPQQLFGLSVLDPLSQSVYWSLFFNAGFLVVGSLVTSPTADGERLARSFCTGTPLPEAPLANADLRVPLLEKRTVVEALCQQYFPAREASQLWNECRERAGLPDDNQVPLTGFARLVHEVEASLAGVLGAAAARKAVVDSGVLTSEETASLSAIYGRVLADLSHSSMDLSRKVDYHREREALLLLHAEELEQRIDRLDQEITERQRAEADRERIREQFFQSQKMEAVGKLAGGVAHDFNNLLTAIIGYIELVREDLPPEGSPTKLLSNAQQAATRASDLVRKLLLFSRKQPLEPKPLRLNELIEGLLTLVGRIIGETVEIRTSLAADLPPILGDATNLEQVLVNLAVNARDAMPRGGTITIATDRRTVADIETIGFPRVIEGDFVCLTVADTGAGMDPMIVAEIFDPFYTTKELGSGLGLAVVYGIVERHGGWIAVDTAPARGTRFSIHLPIASQEATATEFPVVAPALAVRTSSYRGAGTGRILLVEDETMVRELAHRALTRAGHRVVATASAEEALVTFDGNEGRFDLLVSDVVLPGMTGIDLADRIQQRRPGLPVLLNSGYTDDESQWPRMRERGYHFLSKPYLMDTFLRTVEGILHDDAGIVVSHPAEKQPDA